MYILHSGILLCCIHTQLVVPEHHFCNLVPDVADVNITVINNIILSIIKHCILYSFSNDMLKVVAFVLRTMSDEVMHDKARLNHTTLLLIGVWTHRR